MNLPTLSQKSPKRKISWSWVVAKPNAYGNGLKKRRHSTPPFGLKPTPSRQVVEAVVVDEEEGAEGGGVDEMPVVTFAVAAEDVAVNDRKDAAVIAVDEEVEEEVEGDLEMAVDLVDQVEDLDKASMSWTSPPFRLCKVTDAGLLREGKKIGGWC